MKLQTPRGLRDFYPNEMAWHQHLMDAWRRVSVRHGFEQVDGPIFETLDLYKIKSGDGIVSELFSFRRENGKNDYAIRPEFTPTLARMVAAKANALPKPIKWFCTPNFCRAEKPQRGRLREFWQWNVDMLGLDSPVADAEIILVAIDLLRELGLTQEHVRVRVSHRDTARQVLAKLGVVEDKMLEAFDLLDRRAKISDEAFVEAAGKLGLDPSTVQRLDEVCRMRYSTGSGLKSLASTLGTGADLSDLESLDAQLQAFGIADWCEYDLGIVRGLAYYTGTVFEIHEATGVERALAGGGRYDNLIELFGGPKTPAIGFGMGDVVLTNVLHDKGLLPESVMPRPDAFIFATSDEAALRVPALVSKLRQSGLHARMTYKTTRNFGKLMKDASGCKARFAVMVEAEEIQVKNLDSGEQVAVSEGDLLAHLSV